MYGNGHDMPPTPGGTPAEHPLAERFAGGEIDEEEYRRRPTVLRADGSGLTAH